MLQHFSQFVKGTPFSHFKPSWIYCMYIYIYIYILKRLCSRQVPHVGSHPNSLYPGISDRSRAATAAAEGRPKPVQPHPPTCLGMKYPVPGNPSLRCNTPPYGIGVREFYIEMYFLIMYSFFSLYGSWGGLVAWKILRHSPLTISTSGKPNYEKTLFEHL